ncbi:MAG: winged helix-turn-helix domain-containing protein, partial [Dokdonella sp.]
MRYKFAEFELDTERELLIGPAGPITLRPRPLRMLQHLIDAAPAVVSRDELMDTLWGHHALSVNVVTQTISELRQALDDQSSSPRFIETRHRLGYAFVAPYVRLAALPVAATVDPKDGFDTRAVASRAPT